MWIGGRAARAQPRTAWWSGATAWIPIMGASRRRHRRRRARASPTRSRAAGRDPSTLQVQAPLRMAMGDDGTPDLAAQHGIGARARRGRRHRRARDAAGVQPRRRRRRPPCSPRSSAGSTTALGLSPAVRVSAVLTPFDDYPIHQTPLPIAHPATGDPNHYDRFWFNGYTEDYYFAVGHGRVPEPRHHRRRVLGRARRRAAFGVRVGPHPRRSRRRRASGR